MDHNTYEALSDEDISDGEQALPFDEENLPSPSPFAAAARAAGSPTRLSRSVQAARAARARQTPVQSALGTSSANDKPPYAGILKAVRQQAPAEETDYQPNPLTEQFSDNQDPVQPPQGRPESDSGSRSADQAGPSAVPVQPTDLPAPLPQSDTPTGDDPKSYAETMSATNAQIASLEDQLERLRAQFTEPRFQPPRAYGQPLPQPLHRNDLGPLPATDAEIEFGARPGQPSTSFTNATTMPMPPLGASLTMPAELSAITH